MVDREITTIHLWIVQPRCVHPDGPIRHAEITIEECQEWKEKFAKAVAKAKDPDLKFQKGEWCRWCPALITCPEQGMLTVVDRTQDIRRPVSLPEVTSMSASQISGVLKNLPILETWCAALRVHALELAVKGEKIPDFKIVAGRSTRSWANETAAQVFLTNSLGTRAWQEPKLVSPAMAEKLKVKIPAEQIAKTLPKPTLAPITDKRPEFNVDPSQIFETINEVEE
jgi:hypothetical protein